MTIVYIWIALCLIGVPLALLLHFLARRDAKWARGAGSYLVRRRAKSLKRSAFGRALTQIVFLLVGLTALHPTVPYAKYLGWLFVVAEANIVYLILRDLHERYRIRNYS